MEKQLSLETIKLIEKASKQLNMNKELVIVSAIKSYLEEAELKREFESWDKLSDEALENFEKVL
ncbi:MAG: hypothetical protein QT10_C0004G0036 [archaeon GW2011_AR19]|nr:MAG: hypothetical protein QT10_C0004G0036 [archaeon GW2011_AR19]